MAASVARQASATLRWSGLNVDINRHRPEAARVAAHTPAAPRAEAFTSGRYGFGITKYYKNYCYRETHPKEKKTIKGRNSVEHN